MCDKITENEYDILLLQEAIDKAGKINVKEFKKTQDIDKIIRIVENYIRSKKLICYGGTAINNLLPVEDQFYNNTTTLFPDYDVFSKDALKDAKRITDIFVKNGYCNVEAKSGIHVGTYKIYVNFIPVLDLTQLSENIFNILIEESIKVNGILYASPNYLKMSMYLELSRPRGDISRWEKVYKRLKLLEKSYPFHNLKCKQIINKAASKRENKINKKDKMTEMFKIIKNVIIDNDLVFFGGYAISLFDEYLSPKIRQALPEIPEFDVLSNYPKTTATIIKERLEYNGFNKIIIKKHKQVGEIVPLHYEIIVNGLSAALIYKPLGCHSFNTIKINNRHVNVATINTMMSFYLAFLFINRPRYDKERILCLAEQLFKIQQNHKTSKNSVVKTFGDECYGEQTTLEEIRAEKNKKFKQLRHDRKSKEYQKYFLRYSPCMDKDKKNYYKKKFSCKNKNKTKRDKSKKSRKTRKNKFLIF